MSDYQNKISQATIDAYTSGAKKIDVSLGQYFSQGWEIFQKNMGGNLLNGVVLLFLNIVGPFMQSGYFMGLYEERTGGKPMEMGQMFKGFDIAGKIVWHYLASIIAGFVAAIVAMPILFFFMVIAGDNGGIVVLGTLVFYALIFGLIIVILGFLIFAIFLMTFSKLEGMDAIKASIAIARKNMGKAVGFAFIMFLLQFLGAMLCYVGAFVTYPVCVIAMYLFCNDIFKVEQGANSTDEIIEHLV